MTDPKSYPYKTKKKSVIILLVTAIFRLRSVEWKQWKQSYKSLVLLEFLLTHGPEELADEFKRDSYIIEALGTFKHVDERG